MLNKKEARVWEGVERTIEREGCKCGLTPGLSYVELSAFGGGCTSDKETDAGPGEGNYIYVCPALDQYRRELGYPPEQEAA